MILNLNLRDFCHGTQEQVRNSCGKRAISVWAIGLPGLLYMVVCESFQMELECLMSWHMLIGSLYIHVFSIKTCQKVFYNVAQLLFLRN